MPLASEDNAAMGSEDALRDRRVAMIISAISTVIATASRSPSTSPGEREPPNISTTPTSASALHSSVCRVARSTRISSATAALTNGAVP